MKICDVHAHVYPEKIAANAAKAIGDFYEGTLMHEKGTLEGLLECHEDAGIEHAIIHSVAVSPHTVEKINQTIANDVALSPEHCTGFGTIHPDCEDFESVLKNAVELGLKGIKIHPDMQLFELDSRRALEMFDAIRSMHLPVMIHTGDKRYHYSNPLQMKVVLDNFPDLICLCAHLAGYTVWDEASEVLSKYENVYTDVSSSLPYLEKKHAVELIRAFDPTHVLFGSDYPMWNPKEEVERFLGLGLTDNEIERILWDNAVPFM